MPYLIYAIEHYLACHFDDYNQFPEVHKLHHFGEGGFFEGTRPFCWAVRLTIFVAVFVGVNENLA